MTIRPLIDAPALIALQFLFERKRWDTYIRLLHSCDLIHIDRLKFLRDEVSHAFYSHPDQQKASFCVSDLLSRLKLTPRDFVPLPSPTIYSES